MHLHLEVHERQLDYVAKGDGDRPETLDRVRISVRVVGGNEAPRRTGHDPTATCGMRESTIGPDSQQSIGRKNLEMDIVH